MRDYVRGLLGPVGRKNSWQLAEHAGHATPYGLQRLLSWCQRDPDEIRDDLRDYVAERLGQQDGVLIVDDTGFIKKGSVSAGVQRQYSGTAGRTENCQIGVFTAYASAKGRALVDRELYLLKSWTDDRERCRAARIPEDRPFATKPELARAMVLRALGSALPIAWVTADAAYGQERGFRRALEDAGVGYVLAVPKSQQVKSPAGSWRIDHVLTGAPDDAWERISCGDGAKGPRVYDWAAARLPAGDDENGEAPTHHRWVRACRSLARPAEIATTSPSHYTGRPSPSWSAWPAHVGPSRSAFRPRRTSAAWISTRSAATSAGIGTSHWPCLRTASWPRWPPTPSKRGSQKRSRQPRSPHRGRSATAPGSCPCPNGQTATTPAPAPLVTLAPTTPSRRTALPLPAPHTLRSGESRTTAPLMARQSNRLETDALTSTNGETRLEY
jgi:hypothetical protein